MGTDDTQDECMDPSSTGDGMMLRRLRNVTAVQVRNLTPFPVRDSFATAMTQPSEQSQFTSLGRLSDDLDLTVGRRRGRRISSSSVVTTKTTQSEDSEDVHNAATIDDTQRRRAASKVSFLGQATGGSSPHAGSLRRHSQVYGSPSSSRPVRKRTTSTGSYRSLGTSSVGITEENNVPPVTPAPLSRLLPDNSQCSLEKIVSSRLVETFITITVPPSYAESSVGSAPSSLRHVKSTDLASASRPVSPALGTHNTKGTVSAPKHKRGSSASSVSPQHMSRTRPTSSSLRSSSSESSPPSPTRSQAMPSHSRTKSSQVGSRLRSDGSGNNATAPQAFPSAGAAAHSIRVPDYISPIHRPSTNPYFSLDPASGHDFPAWTDLNAQDIKVELWGKVGRGWGTDKLSNGKGKEKAIDSCIHSDESTTWHVLEKWDVKFTDLTPCTEDLASHSSHIAFNTLTITFTPFGRTYYVPRRSLPPNSPRPPSPSGGYNSDLEQPSVTTLGSAGDIIVPASTSGLDDARARASSIRGDQNTAQVTRSKRHPESSKTASWQDLVRLVTLQACILDTKQSLSQILQNVDNLVNDGLNDLKREVSERQAWVDQLHSEIKEVEGTSNDFRTRIRSRAEDLRRRRDVLRQAREELQLDIFGEHEIDEELEDMREQLSSLRSNFSPVRTTLVATLASIFPIELLSTTPDLLYTILDVPLPIPSGSTDPAPPLSVPSRKDINEDTVATALGYAAQVVQLLAAYMGIRLVYPVTCIGSRSLVRDGISTMVGPRMFPLYSKGVDTYRFEYGVYLLNKDIEMLMTERELRAADTRYTLPNLNNLLLTLSAGDGVHLPIPVPEDSQPSSRAESPLPAIDSSSTIVAGDHQVVGETTPPVSGSTTPTAASADNSAFSRMSRPFFSLSPFGLLRSSSSDRPSTKPSKSNAPEPPQDAERNGDARHPQSEQTVDEEEDRRTIRGVSLHGDETKSLVNDNSGSSAVPQPEKATDGSGPEVAAPTTNIVAPIV